MSNVLATASPRVTVRASDDPYKKYWWPVLAGCAVLALWLCLPALETSIGSERVLPPRLRTDRGAEQSLFSPIPGADGSAGTEDGGAAAPAKTVFSEADSPGLYHAPAQVAASGASGAAASGGGTLAQALRDAAAPTNSSGWGGERPERGFDSPQLGQSALHGLDAVSGSSSASMKEPTNFFGSRNAQPVLGPSGEASRAAGAPASGGGLASLRRASDLTARAAAARPGDAASNGVSRAFDGSAANNAIAFSGSGAGTYARLDAAAAPANLKVNDPKLDRKDLKSPQGVPPSSPAPSDNMAQQMAVTVGAAVASAAIAGLVPGLGGQLIAMALMSAAQVYGQQMQANREQQLKAQQRVGNTLNGVGG